MRNVGYNSDDDILKDNPILAHMTEHNVFLFFEKTVYFV